MLKKHTKHTGRGAYAKVPCISAMHNCLASALRGIRQGPAWHYARHLCMAKYRSRQMSILIYLEEFMFPISITFSRVPMKSQDKWHWTTIIDAEGHFSLYFVIKSLCKVYIGAPSAKRGSTNI